MSKYLKLYQQPSPGKTEIWLVVSKRQGVTLGVIKWFGRWRQYCFEPCANTVWSDDCLEAVQEKTRELMEARRK